MSWLDPCRCALLGHVFVDRDKSKRALNLWDFTFHDDKELVDKLGRKNAWELRAKPDAVLGEKEERIVRCSLPMPLHSAAPILSALLL